MCKKLFFLVSPILLLGLVSSASADLVAHWKFDEGSGDTAFDSSGNGYDAILVNNPVWVPGKLGAGALNTQAGGYGGIQGLFYETSGIPEVSVCAWIRTSSSGGQYIISFDRDQYYRLEINGSGGGPGQVGWDVRTDAGTHDYGSVTRVDDGEWHHVCGIFDNGTSTIYIDGEPEPSETSGSTMGRNTLRYGYIGKNSEATVENQADPGGNPLDGDIDDLRIYDHALSLGEILAAMVGEFTWPFALSPEPADGALVEATWASLAWEPGGFAVSHDVYFSDNFEDVNTGAEAAFQGNKLTTDFIVGFLGFPVPDGLVPGMKYYWRIDEVNDADPNSPWKGDVWSFTVPPKTAYNPDPPDGMKFIDPSASLGWTAGLGAIFHHVYFGNNFDDVNNASDAAGIVDLTFTPGALERDMEYYWRVDEFDGAAVNKGEVWSFTTIPPIAVGDPSLVGWWKLDEGLGKTAVDWSGYDHHGTIQGDSLWAGGYDLGALEFTGAGDFVEATGPESVTGTRSRTVTAWIKTSALGEIASWGQNVAGQKWIFRVQDSNGQAGAIRIEVNGGYQVGSTDVRDGLWHHVAAVLVDDGSPDVMEITLYVDSQLEEISAQLDEPIDTADGVVRIGQSPWGSRPFIGLIDDLRVYDRELTREEIQLVMRIDLSQAWAPSPADELLVPMNVAGTLNWSAGDGASRHDVYFGTDEAAVADANASDTTGLYRDRRSTTSYALPEGVDPNSGPFYWRVDEVANDGTIVAGRLWSFSVTDYALIDDFESYNDIPAGEPGSNLVYVAWVDGFDNPNVNGSTMGYVTGASLEPNDVHGGSRSVPFQYNNTTAGVSEVVRTFTPAQDWTANGVITLSLWFAGAGTNVSGQLYVKVNGVQVNYGGDAGNLALAGWQPWNIDLASIGTNLSSVTSLAIGVQGPGATGVLLLDDIRLYPFPREVITPVQPDIAGLVLHYAFDGNTNDSAGANHGTAFGAPTYSLGRIGQAINLDGFDDYVAIDNFSYAGIGHPAVSVCAWIRTSLEDNQIIASFDRDNYWRLEINGDGGGPGQVGWDVMTNTGQVDYGSGASVDDGQWHHVAGVFDNGILTVYLDGNAATSDSGGPTFGTGTPRFGYIGLGSESTTFNADPRTPADFFNGAVDDVRIYDRALTNGEVAGLAGRISPFDKPF